MPGVMPVATVRDSDSRSTSLNAKTESPLRSMIRLSARFVDFGFKTWPKMDYQKTEANRSSPRLTLRSARWRRRGQRLSVSSGSWPASWNYCCRFYPTGGTDSTTSTESTLDSTSRTAGLDLVGSFHGSFGVLFRSAVISL